MSSIQYRNVRTDQVVDVEQGSEDERRLAGLPLVWHPLADPSTGEVPPTPTAGEPGSVDADPALVLSPPPAPPKPAAKIDAWREYAIARGGDPAAVKAAPKAALVALYG